MEAYCQKKECSAPEAVMVPLRFLKMALHLVPSARAFRRLSMQIICDGCLIPSQNPPVTVTYAGYCRIMFIYDDSMDLC